MRAAAARGAAAVGVLVWTVACGVTDPLPSRARRFTPPPVYARWWAMTEACSGIQRPLDRVAWYVVPAAAYLRLKGEIVDGFEYAIDGHERIVLAASAQLDGALVRHEMLHALLSVDGHPRAAFLGRCAGVVVCVDACIRDAGPAPVPGAAVRRVPAESLQVAVHVDPAQPAASTDLGYFSLVVTARNASADSVAVVLPPSGDDGPPAAFRFSIGGEHANASYDDRAWDPELTLFAPGEVKQEVFDLRAGGDPRTFGIALGRYVALGGYGDEWSAPLAVTVGP